MIEVCHTSLLVQRDLAYLPWQKHSKQIPPDVNCLQAPTSMTSYPAKDRYHSHQLGKIHSDERNHKSGRE